MNLCKVDYATDKFIHASTFSYNEMMRLLEFAGVAKQAWWHRVKGMDAIIHHFYIYRNVYIHMKCM